MATVQECCGLPVLAARSKNGVYDPQGTNALGRMLIEQVRNIDPTVTETRIVNIMLAARRKHAGKAVRFKHYFPTYGKKFKQVGSALTH